MKKRTKSLQFPKNVRLELIERDRGCFFCKRGIHMTKITRSDMAIFDPMHIVNKSQGGLGVVENGLIGCRGHHHLMDNSEYGPEMREIAKDYLRIRYPGWTEEMVTYSKWAGFKHC